MLARYLRVRGVPGALVAHPHADPTARRFLGKKPNGLHWQEGPMRDGKPAWPAAVVAEEIVREDGEGYLRKAIAKGDLVLVAQCVASSPDEAEKKLAAPVKAARTEK